MELEYCVSFTEHVGVVISALLFCIACTFLFTNKDVR